MSELNTWLAERGWTDGTPYINKAISTCSRQWYKRFNDVVPPCSPGSENAGVQIVLNEYTHDYWTSYELTLYGEIGGLCAIKLMCYAIGNSEVLMMNLDGLCITLINAWRGANGWKA